MFDRLERLSLLVDRLPSRSIKRDDLLNYIRTHYRAPRMVLAAAGGIDHEQLVHLGEQHFGKLPSDLSVDLDKLTPCKYWSTTKSIEWNVQRSLFRVRLDKDSPEVKFASATISCLWHMSPLLFRVQDGPMQILYRWWSHRPSSAIGTGSLKRQIPTTEISLNLDRWQVVDTSPLVLVNKHRNTISSTRIKPSILVTPTLAYGELIWWSTEWK